MKQLETFKALPHSVEAEQMLLSCVFLDYNVFYKVENIINNDMFYRKEHKLIYEYINICLQKHKSFDPILLIAELKTNNQIKNCGDAEYIHAISQIAYSCIHAKIYAEQIKEFYILRQAIQSSEEFIDRCYKLDNTELSEIINEHTNKLIKYNQTTDTAVYDIDDMINIIKKLNDEKDDKIAFNNKALDYCTEGGLQRGELIILGAKTNMGKTLVAVDLFTNMSKTNNCIFFSLEMTVKEMTKRVYSNLTSQNTKNQITKGAIDDLINECNYRKNMCIIDDSRLNLNKIKNYILDYKLKYKKIDVIFIDYLQIMTRDLKTSEYDFLCYMTRELKLLAKEYDIAIVLLSQLSRAGAERKEKRPTTADLRGSGSIEQDADMILFLHREQYYFEELGYVGDDVPFAVRDVLEIICAKNRRTEKFKTLFEIDMKHMRLNLLSAEKDRLYKNYIKNNCN